MANERIKDREQPARPVEVEQESHDEPAKRDRTTESKPTQADVKADEAISDRFQATDN
jgi:hypothetical protein